MNDDITNLSWKIIDTYFNDNPEILVAHHLDSYNNFFNSGINRIFYENNPIRFQERDEGKEFKNECFLYLGGKQGDKIYLGKPIIYDENNTHYMYPNDARLRNMTYGITIQYDVDVDFIYYEDGERIDHTITLEKIYLGRFPIMIQSNLCILDGLSRDVRFNMGECRNDYGGYFIIDGKEKVIVSQEKFAENILNIKKNKSDDTYSYSAEIRSVSEDSSKPIRTTAVKVVAPSPNLSNNQLVVTVPNVKKEMPLFIVMRALGVESDLSIIKYCLLDLGKNKSYMQFFIPSIHDANKIFNQQTALEYIATFTKRGTVSSVMEILSDYFLPHIGELNFLDKAYYLGYMSFSLLKVFNKENRPTDRDNFRFKRVELVGTLLYDLFREYYLIQKKEIAKKIDEEYYYHKGEYKEGDKSIKDKQKKTDRPKEADKYNNNFTSLIESNFKSFFKERTLETGFKKAFKGNWGSQSHTKRLGVVQDLNRLSWNSFISHMRKLNLPLDSNAKVVGPRLLNGSQWGFIDPIDTPDGGNIGLHKHLAISASITSGASSKPIIDWFRFNTPIKLLMECSQEYIANTTKIFVNGNWIGVIDNPIELVKKMRLYRRNGIISVHSSITFLYETNEIYIYTDAGRLIRPIYYIENETVSYKRKEIIEMIQNQTIDWQSLISGTKKKPDDYHYKNNTVFNLFDLYPDLNKDDDIVRNNLEKNKSVLEYLDANEEETSFIAVQPDDLKKSKYYTHLEVDPSFLLGVMGNQIIYPENNPGTRNSFSCGQSRQAVSVYHSNFASRIDKSGILLNCGQIPLVKSRYLEYLNKEEQPYGVNTIVAIMSYTGYNVEDAILINKGSIDRGLFRTTYFSMYEDHEESSKVTGLKNSKFASVEKNNVINKKKGYDYSHLDDYGMIKEGTELNDKTIVIGKIQFNMENQDIWIDDSVKPKKGQLGFVDKAFITNNEDGFNTAKVRIREERIPAIGDKMASRAGQKGTIGLIIPENDMPFTSDGLKPDLIINPHAIPSRMTIGQILESLFGKLCTSYGAFGDCTAFKIKGINYTTYAPLMVKAGFNSSGNQVMYNGMTGETLASDIYIGPTYYMRLKHMTKDKINYRARGPNNVLTKQPVQGRANDGGLRIGEMERDGVLAHGMSYFLNESFLVRGDEYFIAVCNKTGCLAIYNKSKNLFLSPLADGPIKFSTTSDGKMNVENVSRYGRSFSILRVPYALKLFIQELEVMNIQMRIITDENINRIESMSYSSNPVLLLNKQDTLEQSVLHYGSLVRLALQRKKTKRDKIEVESESDNPFEGVNVLKITDDQKKYSLTGSETGEDALKPELTQDMLEDPSKTFYKEETLEDGIKKMVTKYPPPYDIIGSLSKKDQRWLIQQPMMIQQKILKEIYDKQSYLLLRQKDKFQEGKVDTPFLKPPIESSDTQTSSIYNPTDISQLPNVSVKQEIEEIPSDSPQFDPLASADVTVSTATTPPSDYVSPEYAESTNSIENNQSNEKEEPKTILEVEDLSEIPVKDGSDEKDENNKEDKKIISINTESLINKTDDTNKIVNIK
jgi:DNA-directed RNA polymerase II subunit RPB2